MKEEAEGGKGKQVWQARRDSPIRTSFDRQERAKLQKPHRTQGDSAGGGGGC